jgi:hypothetical protein
MKLGHSHSLFLKIILDKKLIETLEKAAKILIPTEESKILVRSIGEVLSPAEINRLTPDQKKKFSKITNPTRKREWSESRRCEWELKDYSVRSFSHSGQNEEATVFAWGAHSAVRGIGIDAELVAREITEATAQKFVSDEERKLGLTPLQIWTIKEAVFKSNPDNKDTLVSQYLISSFDAAKGSGEASGPKKDFYSFSVREIERWVISLARSF